MNWSTMRKRAFPVPCYYIPECCASRSSQILRVCQQTHDEGRPILYSCNHFNLVEVDLRHRFSTIVSTIGDHNFKLIRNISIHPRIFWGEETLLKETGSQMDTIEFDSHGSSGKGWNFREELGAIFRTVGVELSWQRSFCGCGAFVAVRSRRCSRTYGTEFGVRLGLL